jgi:heme/copper-type cytochrome/quinol oxidase subunit 2
MTLTLSPRKAVLALCTGLFLLGFAMPLATNAQTFSGNGMGVQDASDINTGGSSDLRETATEILFRVISYMGLIAVCVIVIAGIFLIVGGGTEDSRNKAIKIIIYVAVGLIVIVLASAFVTFVVETASGS